MKMTYTSSIVRKNLLVSQWQNSWSLSGSWDQIKSGDPSKRVRHCPGFCCTDFPSWNTSNYCPGNVPGSVATNIWRDFLYVCFTVSTIRWESSVLAELFPFSSQYNIYSPALSLNSELPQYTDTQDPTHQTEECGEPDPWWPSRSYQETLWSDCPTVWNSSIIKRPSGLLIILFPHWLHNIWSCYTLLCLSRLVQ